MKQPLELTERLLLRQSASLLERALTESGDDDAAIIRNVRKIVSVTAQAGPEAIQFIENTEPWDIFRLMYPNEATSILVDARGIVESN